MKTGQKSLGYKCIQCQSRYSSHSLLYTCTKCGENLDYLVNYQWVREHWSKEDLARNRDRSIWRYEPLLPVQSGPENRSLQVGATPLVSLPHFAQTFGLEALYIKDDTRNPSGTLKDRASAIALRHGEELGFQRFMAASTGNAAASLAGLAAFYQKEAVILVPASAPMAKLVQILQYGATLCPVDGTYDQAFDLSMEAAQNLGFYSRSTGINPVLSEGKKTVALEIMEDLDWQAPHKVFVPVGDGCIIGGVFKGFYDLFQLGWIHEMPQIIAVQAEGSSAVARALENEGHLESVHAQTLADSISVDFPRDGRKALRAVQETGGFAVTLTDREILEAQKELSSVSGIFAEPAGAASFGGFRKAFEKAMVQKGERVVLLATGTGLKDIPKAEKLVSLQSPIPPTLKALEALLAL